ncbi:MAG: tyrosine recombinase [Erysipelotrichaceae bacterium]|nr:tyrosine recombinase [Erysipelotrichaceae bacterium]
MKMVEALKEFKIYLKLEKGLSDHTVEGYLRDLIDFANIVQVNDVNDLTKDHIQSYLLAIRDYAPRSRQRKIVALRQLFLYLRKDDIVDQNIMENFDLPKLPQHLPDVLTMNDIAKMLKTLGDEPVDVRNYAMILLLMATGIRVSELVNLTTNDVNLRAKMLHVIGKGNKERLIPIDDTTCDILKGYMYNERKELNVQSSQWLFMTKKGQPISRENFYGILRHIGQVAGVKKVTPHMLRHTFATTMLNNDADLRSIQELLGHSDISTTTIYTHVSNQKIFNDYQQFHPGNRKKE